MTDSRTEFEHSAGKLLQLARASYREDPIAFRVKMSRLCKSEQRQVRRWIENGTAPRRSMDLSAFAAQRTVLREREELREAA